MNRSWIGFTSAFFLLACGGTSTSGGADAGDASVPVDAAGDAAGDAGGCVASPKIGDACTAGQTSCDHVDPCCTQTVVCDGKTWNASGIACLLCPSFSCGPQTCTGGTMCVTRASGVDGGTTSYACDPMPADCARNWTCDCVTKHLPANCTLSSPNGCVDPAVHPTLTCMGQ